MPGSPGVPLDPQGDLPRRRHYRKAKKNRIALRNLRERILWIIPMQLPARKRWSIDHRRDSLLSNSPAAGRGRSGRDDSRIPGAAGRAELVLHLKITRRAVANAPPRNKARVFALMASEAAALVERGAGEKADAVDALALIARRERLGSDDWIPRRPSPAFRHPFRGPSPVYAMPLGEPPAETVADAAPPPSTTRLMSAPDDEPPPLHHRRRRDLAAPPTSGSGRRVAVGGADRDRQGLRVRGHADRRQEPGVAGDRGDAQPRAASGRTGRGAPPSAAASCSPAEDSAPDIVIAAAGGGRRHMARVHLDRGGARGRRAGRSACSTSSRTLRACRRCWRRCRRCGWRSSTRSPPTSAISRRARTCG